MGAPYEFKGRDSYSVSSEIEEVKHFKLPAGSYTDDSSMMLCTVHSFIEYGGFDAVHLMNTFLRWMFDGFLSVNGTCFDVGRSTRMALMDWREVRVSGGSPFVGSRSPDHSGNGAIMRLAPFVLWFHNDIDTSIKLATLGTMLTHTSDICLETSRLMTLVMFGFLNGCTKEEVIGGFLGTTQVDAVNELYAGTFRNKTRDSIMTSGYVVHTLEAALWAIWNSESFEDGIMLLLPLGEDVDTVCCVYGQIAGALYGLEGIPRRWLDALQNRALLDEIICSFIETKSKKY